MAIAPMPPRLCPICKERLWEEDRISRNLALRYYLTHVHNTHPEFQRWNSRLVWKFRFAVIVIILAQFLQVVIDVGLRLEIIWLGLVVTAVATMAFQKRRGTGRFRRSWMEEHGMPSKQ